MVPFSQANRVLQITTPLGDNFVLLRGFSGFEAVSRLFEFHLDLVAPKPNVVNFPDILGKSVTVTINPPGLEARYFNGIITQIAKGANDGNFTYYRAVLSPIFWCFTRVVQSRIFEQMSVPDILRQILVGFDTTYSLSGTYNARNYCVQYRESDFNFASRLMEECGIRYYFVHSDGNHKMALTDTTWPTLSPEDSIALDDMGGGTRADDRIQSWELIQDLASGKFTLWDYNFQLQGRNLQAAQTISSDPISLPTGDTINFQVGGNSKFEIYDFPGGYAKRYDGIDAGGGEQAAELQKIFSDNTAVATLRMQAEEGRSLGIVGTSNARSLAPGNKFTLLDGNNELGNYLLTSVQHTASQQVDYNTSGAGTFSYSNRFTCTPSQVPYLPIDPSVRMPVIGLQTAFVTGPAGQDNEPFVDKYGRVHVQFNWDRLGQKDTNSSCWLRVVQPWAGKTWGHQWFPRIGHEVVVDFLEGDPDNPIIIGSVYNPTCMPTYELPANSFMSGIKTRSTPGGGDSNFNELRFEDKTGKELIAVHAEKDLQTVVENDEAHQIGANQYITIQTNRNLTVGGNVNAKIVGNDNYTLQGNSNAKITGTLALQVTGSATENFQASHTTNTTSSETIIGESILLQATNSITIVAGASAIVLGPSGITIDGAMVKINMPTPPPPPTVVTPGSPPDEPETAPQMGTPPSS